MSGRQAAIVAWWVVAAATAVTAVVGLEHPGAHRLVAVGLIVLAIGKAWLVMMFFMEVRAAPRALQLLVHAYAALVTITLVGLFLFL